MLFVLLLLGAVNATLFSIGVIQAGKHEWVKASLELMSVILPFLLLAVALFFSSSIATQTHRKTLEFLLVHAPTAFESLREADVQFRPSGKRVTKTDLVTGRSTTVLVRHSPGSCCADYQLSVPPNPARNSLHPQTVLLRLELNVHRLTFCLGIEAQRIPPAEEPDDQAYLRWFLSRFESTLSGAKHAAQLEEAAPEEIHDTYAGYNFNRSGVTSLDGQQFRLFVASRDLANDFLWDASERIYILQDMIFMLRAFLGESPELFYSQSMENGVGNA
jgi:hypothetical protein